MLNVKTGPSLHLKVTECFPVDFMKFEQSELSLTEEDAGSAGLSATGEGHRSYAATLVEGNELVKVMEIGEHLRD